MTLRRTPLAWKNLTHDWRRLSVALGGICFAVLLMFMQRGFQNALFDSQVKLIDDLDERAAQVLIVSKARYALPIRRRFPRLRLYQALAVPGVRDCYPVYLETRFALLSRSGRHGHAIRVIGFNLRSPVFGAGAVGGLAGELRRPYTAIIDRKSKREKFPFDFDDPEKMKLATAELVGRPIQLVGAFSMGTDFATEGSLLMSEENFARYFSTRAPGGDPLSVVDVGVVRLRDGARPGDVAQALRSSLPDDVLVFTRDEFRNREIDFWDRSTPIGMIFSTGTILGFVVGMIICYQIIYTDIADHMPEFATLKAMGYTNAYFVRLIVAESVYLSLLGFVPGALLSWGAYGVLASTTGLLLNMTPWRRVAIVLALTVAMCVASGLLALRKLAAADPADLF